jgi:hypothetical protein
MAGTDRGHSLLRTTMGGAGPGVLARAEGHRAHLSPLPRVDLAQVPILVFLGLRPPPREALLHLEPIHPRQLYKLLLGG